MVQVGFQGEGGVHVVHLGEGQDDPPRNVQRLGQMKFLHCIGQDAQVDHRIRSRTRPAESSIACRRDRCDPRTTSRGGTPRAASARRRAARCGFPADDPPGRWTSSPGRWDNGASTVPGSRWDNRARRPACRRSHCAGSEPVPLGVGARPRPSLRRSIFMVARSIRAHAPPQRPAFSSLVQDDLR